MLFLEPRQLFPGTGGRHDLRGHTLPEGVNPGLPRDALYTVADIYPDHVVLDGHPLAGISLRLAIKVHAVREATPEELQQGSAGAGFFRSRLRRLAASNCIDRRPMPPERNRDSGALAFLVSLRTG